MNRQSMNLKIIMKTSLTMKNATSTPAPALKTSPKTSERSFRECHSRKRPKESSFNKIQISSK